MKSTDIKEVKYNGNEVIALYKGGNLIYRKQDDTPPGNVLAGSFTEAGNYTFTYNTSYIQPISLNADLTFRTNVDVESVVSYNKMFNIQRKLNSIDLFPDTPNVTDLSFMFNCCSALTKVNLTNLIGKNVTDVTCMFSDCSALREVKLSNFNTENVATMTLMFSGCSSLKELDLTSFNTGKVTSMSNMFANCSSLKELDLTSFNTENVTNMSNMFYNCSTLRELNLSDLDFTNVDYMTYIFYGCTALETVTGNISNIMKDIDLHYSPLNHDSVMVFFNGLADVTSKKTITLSQTSWDQLYYAADMLLATDKGWTVAVA